MKSTLTLLALAASSQALVARQDAGCCFGLNAYSGEAGPTGPVGQLADGQNRIRDSSLPAGRYCLGADGGMVDANGRGCILTPPTTQLQCDVGAAPTQGFSLSCNGTLQAPSGSTTFFSCPTGEREGWNIYTEPVEGQFKCLPAWLKADSCFAGCEKPTPPPAPPSPPPPPPAAVCPAELQGAWEFPHLIIPVSSIDADKAFGTSFNGSASGAQSSIFDYDIPESYAGKECTLEFLFPIQAQLETSAFEYSPGMFEFAFLDGYATQETTYATAPKAVYNFGKFELKPGTATTIGQCPHGCPAGKRVSFWMSAVGDASINYFQDSNPCPIGLYVTAA